MWKHCCGYKNHSSHNNPFVLEEFKLQSGDFYIESSNVNNDNCYCFSIGVKKVHFLILNQYQWTRMDTTPCHGITIIKKV